jgi:hypothetical protein
VPNEFKARNQIEAGFDSVIFWCSTINKSVNWINYIYYNQQNFVNYIRAAAIKGTAEQMALGKQAKLDMILAKKGGVCIMIGVSCYTYTK